MDNNLCIEKLRQLVSDIQGAPYPGADFEPELYKIWYEHVQQNATECLELLNSDYPQPDDNEDISSLLKKI